MHSSVFTMLVMIRFQKNTAVMSREVKCDTVTKRKSGKCMLNVTSTLSLVNS